MQGDLFAADPDIEQLRELLGGYLHPGPAAGSPQAQLVLEISLRLRDETSNDRPEIQWLLRDARLLALSAPADLEMLWARLRDTARRLRDHSACQRMEDPCHAATCALDVLSLARLARLTGLSESDLEQIASGRDITPNPRLSCVSQCLYHLLAGFTQQGAADWFDRPRPQLAGRTPAEVLGDPIPDCAGLVRLAQGAA